MKRLIDRLEEASGADDRPKTKYPQIASRFRKAVDYAEAVFVEKIGDGVYFVGAAQQDVDADRGYVVINSDYVVLDKDALSDIPEKYRDGSKRGSENSSNPSERADGVFFISSSGNGLEIIEMLLDSLRGRINKRGVDYLNLYL